MLGLLLLTYQGYVTTTFGYSVIHKRDISDNELSFQSTMLNRNIVGMIDKCFDKVLNSSQEAKEDCDFSKTGVVLVKVKKSKKKRKSVYPAEREVKNLTDLETKCIKPSVQQPCGDPLSCYTGK